MKLLKPLENTTKKISRKKWWIASNVIKFKWNDNKNNSSNNQNIDYVLELINKKQNKIYYFPSYLKNNDFSKTEINALGKTIPAHWTIKNSNYNINDNIINLINSNKILQIGNMYCDLPGKTFRFTFKTMIDEKFEHNLSSFVEFYDINGNLINNEYNSVNNQKIKIWNNCKFDYTVPPKTNYFYIGIIYDKKNEYDNNIIKLKDFDMYVPNKDKKYNITQRFLLNSLMYTNYINNKLRIGDKSEWEWRIIKRNEFNEKIEFSEYRKFNIEYSR